MVPALRFSASMPSRIGNGARAGGAIEHHVDALAAGDLLDARERVFLAAR